MIAPLLCLLALLLSLPVGARGSSDDIEVRARLALEAPQIEGTVRLRWRRGENPARSVRLRLFANRFRDPPPWNDLSRHFLLTTPTYQPGGTEIVSVEAEGRRLSVRESAAGEATIVTVDPGREVESGEELVLEVRFRTTLPTIADTFGAWRDLWIASEGWYPTIAADEATAAPQGPVGYSFTVAEGGSLLVNGEPNDRSVLVGGRSASGWLSLVLSRRPLEVKRLRVGERPVTIVSASPFELHHRISRNASAEAALLDSLPAILSGAAGDEPLVIARLPLRWYPSASLPDLVMVSDRLFDLHPLLRPLHQRELAYAVFLHDELRRARRREPAGDARWVAEGLAWRRADALYHGRFREGRDVRDWIRLFDLFAVVDRFETAPRIPFLRAFFPVISSDEPLRIRPESPAEALPPGRLVFSRLEARLRPEAFAALLERHAGESRSLREVLRGSVGDGGVAFLDSWLAPVPVANHSIAESERNPKGAPGARFRIFRESADDRPHTLEVGLETAAGMERLFVDVDRPLTEVSVSAVADVDAIELDPERSEIETRLDDNRAPPELHVLLDSADVEVSSTEFGVSTLLVARRRYDYRKDLAAAGFLTSRSLGTNAGFQLHGGAPIDRNLFRHNLFLYYSIQELDRDFRNESAPAIRTAGRLGGGGFRYNFYDAFWFENPSLSRHVRAFFDVYDESAGGDFNYVQTGGSVTVTTRLRADTVFAAQALNGFSVSTGHGPIPNQGLFSLGGFRSIRGIAAEEDLAENIFILRAELRRLLPVRLDLNFEELVIARRLQVKAFADAGRVENRRGRLYDPEGYAVGAGAGVNLFYDFLGFFPTSFYLDVATRVDRRSSVQILFGARQAF
ncbi:MAG: hypothetical protein ACREQ9_01425 [Candidatus Binatia bacterium]